MELNVENILLAFLVLCLWSISIAILVSGINYYKCGQLIDIIVWGIAGIILFILAIGVTWVFMVVKD